MAVHVSHTQVVLDNCLVQHFSLVREFQEIVMPWFLLSMKVRACPEVRRSWSHLSKGSDLCSYELNGTKPVNFFSNTWETSDACSHHIILTYFLQYI